MKVNLNSNESGFTLLESLIALIVSSFILLLLNAAILQLNKIKDFVIVDAQNLSSSPNKIHGSRQIEWHIFLAQLESYLKDTELITWNTQRITVQEKDEKKEWQDVRYGRALSGNKNFYRNNNNGYNEMLIGIQEFTINLSNNCLILSCTFQNGENYEGRIWIESWLEEEKEST
ncbi:MAG: ComGF family competence protein [Atopostipes suicloacalis]|nr:ComGF family competence protein [Atopostipes suicloacalis]